MPANLPIESEAFLPGWRAVRNLDGCEHGRKIEEAKRYFFLLADEIGAISFGREGLGTAAVEEGIVAGGGTALLRCLPALEKLKLHDDEAIGVDIVKRALEEPMRQIAQNAGQEGAFVVGQVSESKEENFGFNAETDEFGDLVKDGVIDPAKVTRLALQNAASILSLMLTTEVLIADAKGEEKIAAADAGHGGGMGGMY